MGPLPDAAPLVVPELGLPRLSPRVSVRGFADAGPWGAVPLALLPTPAEDQAEGYLLEVQVLADAVFR